MNLRPLALHVGVLSTLAITGTLLFAQVLNTPFWSPEDINALRAAAQAHARGELGVAFRPALAGGYPVNPLFALEFQAFGLDARPYLAVNLIVHVLNAYLAFLLIRSLLHDNRGAFIASLLFVLTVGSYGKNLMFAGGISSLAYATTCLVAMLLYVYNETRCKGRFWSWPSLAFHALFVVSLFMRGGSFSILAAVLFYNVFFAQERERRILHTNLLVAFTVIMVAVIARAFVGEGGAGVHVDAGAFLRNLPGYLILMVFPLQSSALLEDAPRLISMLYAGADVIRVVIGLTILSYSLFGFIFGNRAVRFYIAWIYVMTVPFAFFRYPADWLNLRFLYLVSVGFCVLLTSGTLFAYRLLQHRRYRRYVAFSIIALYAVVSVALVSTLDRKNETLAQEPATLASKARIAALLEDR